MALSPRSQEEPAVPSLGKQFSSQLAAAVRSINWTYAIFWSISTSSPGVLTWKDRFYNGEVKTRKINNAADLTAGQLLLQRSEQLRELYESLLSGECDDRARRPAGSLSPEDLGDAESLRENVKVPTASICADGFLSGPSAQSLIRAAPKQAVGLG